MSFIGPAILSLLLAGCDFFPETPDGPVGGPPAECIEVPRDACAAFWDSWRELPQINAADVDRVFVLCLVARCDESEGEVEVRVRLRNGQVVPAGGGAYATAPVPVPE